MESKVYQQLGAEKNEHADSRNGDCIVYCPRCLDAYMRIIFLLEVYCCKIEHMIPLNIGLERIISNHKGRQSA